MPIINSADTERKYNLDSLAIDTKSRAFKRFSNSGLLDELDESYIHNVQAYWKNHYNKKIDPVLHIAFKNLTGQIEPRIIPSKQMWNEIIPFFNDMNIRIGYSDKNIYDKLIAPSSTAETVIKRVRGHYFDSNNNCLNTEDAYKQLISNKENLIIKPSDTDNGKGIAMLKYNSESIQLDSESITMGDLEKLYGFNFIIQKVIKQHSVMAAPHPASVNTLRMVTFRWKNEIRYLLSFARFGANEDVRDNAGTGGLCLGVNDSGEFLDFAIDENAIMYNHHPTTGYNFSDYAQIPNFEDFKKFVINLHKDVLHHDFVSWDIAVGTDGQPIFIEANFRGATWIYQLASQKPLFGELTEEVLHYVNSELEKNRFSRNVSSNVPLLREQNRKLKRENKKVLKEKSKISASLITKKSELDKTKKEYDKVIYSRSWKITLPLRKLGRIYKELFIKNRA